jgi:predicted phosphoribosyltransferase
MDGFIDRADGGRQLAESLQHYAGRPDTIVLALPRGGVPVGYEVARALDLPLDVLLVRKLGVPGHEDGLATGSTMRAAVSAVRRRGAGRIVVAVPVAAPEAAQEFKLDVDEFVCLLTPEWFAAVGEWYSDFSQTTDQQVTELLERARKEHLAHVH